MTSGNKQQPIVFLRIHKPAGHGLANTNPGRTWRADEIVGGRLPTALDGVSVTINGKAAYVYYISPAQINVQAPTDGATGAVNVVVTNNGSVSAPATAELLAFAPVDRHAGCREGGRDGRPAGHQHLHAEGEGFEPPAQGWFPEQRFSRTPVNKPLTWDDTLTQKLKVTHESRSRNPGCAALQASPPGPWCSCSRLQDFGLMAIAPWRESSDRATDVGQEHGISVNAARRAVRIQPPPVAPRIGRRRNRQARLLQGPERGPSDMQPRSLWTSGKSRSSRSRSLCWWRLAGTYRSAACCTACRTETTAERVDPTVRHSRDDIRSGACRRSGGMA